METIIFNNPEQQLKSFPYQLLKWQRIRQGINKALFFFKKYKEEDDGVIVKSSLGYSIFTRGESLITYKERSGL